MVDPNEAGIREEPYTHKRACTRAHAPHAHTHIIAPFARGGGKCGNKRRNDEKDGSGVRQNEGNIVSNFVNRQLEITKICSEANISIESE